MSHWSALPVRQGDTVVTGASVIHPGASTVDELDSLLRRGEVTLRATSVGDGSGVQVPAVLFDDFDLRDWAKQYSENSRDGQLLRQVAGRATLSVQSACCAGLAAISAARLTEQERADTAVVIAGNNLALGYQSRTATAFAADPSQVRAGHLLQCFDTDALGAVGEVTGCTGEGWMIGGSSAAGTLALIHATRLVAAGLVPRALVVAPVNELSALEMLAFVKAGAMARLAAGDDASEACRPFDKVRAGIAAAHIAAGVVVEPLAQARHRGIRPLGRVIGFGTSTDGKRGTHPNAVGQAKAMRLALDNSGMAAADIDSVNAHATGSAVGDEVEAEALASVFGTALDGPWINATKALLGHGLGSAGLVEAIAALLQLGGGYCHANPQLTDPLRPDLLLVSERVTPTVLRATMSNSFAFSGINASVILGVTAEDIA